MGRWWKSGQMLRTNLAAGGVVALLFLSACGDDAKDQASGQNAESSAVETAAVKIDPAEAPLIQKSIEEYLALMEGPAEQRVLHHDAIKVTPEENAFAVSVEGVRVGAKEAEHMEIGTITYRLTPQGSDGYIVSDLAHAPRFPNRDSAGKETGSLSLKTTSFTGEWSSSLQSLLSLNWQAADIVATDSGERGGDMRASSLTVTVASDDKGGGLFDQTGTVELAGLVAKDETGGSLGLDKLSGRFGLGKVKLKEYVEKTRELQTLTAALADQATAAPDTAPDAASGGNPTLTPEQAARMGELIKGMGAIMASIDYDVEIGGASFKEADGSEPFRLGNGRFKLGMSGLDGEKASLNFGLGHDGLVIRDPDITATPLFEKLLPGKGELALTLSDVPTKELWSLIGDQFPALVAGDQNQAEAAMNVMFIAMGQLLQQAPMKLKMGPSGLSAEVLQVGAAGTFDVLPEAVFGLVGALDVDVFGLDGAMQMATEAAQTSADAAQIVGGLAMIQSLAKREADSDGKPVDRLKIEVDATGDTKVNGVSLSGM